MTARAIWALGDYPTVAAEVIPALGPVLVETCGIGPGHRVLDVAAGTGNVAIPAALTGADVTAADVTPELLAAGSAEAERRGVKVQWQEADAEALPFGDAEFDAVLSCVGVMFAPHHQRAADELVRVCRPGGLVGLVNWTPEGFIGQLFAAMKPYVPAPPPSALPPPLWGDPGHVDALFDDRLADVSVRRATLRVDRFPTAEAFRDYFRANYGPTIAAYRAVGADEDRRAALDEELADLARRHDVGGGAMEWEYLLYTGRRVTRPATSRP